MRESICQAGLILSLMASLNGSLLGEVLEEKEPSFWDEWDVSGFFETEFRGFADPPKHPGQQGDAAFSFALAGVLS